MDKKRIMIVSGIVIVVIACIYFLTRGNSLDEQKEIVSNYDTYIMTCNMDLLENDELKSFQIEVTYQQAGEYYKVSIYDKSLNQAQVIIRNEEGVFVVTPSLNQTFQFQSEWPTNYPKPYIYESLLQGLEEGEVEKTNDGYHVAYDTSYENDERVASQEIFFDKELKPMLVQVYDVDGLEIITVEVTDFLVNEDLDDDTFDPTKVVSDTTVSYVEQMVNSLPLYPVASLGASLVSEEVSVIGDVTNHILQFDGETSYTMIQSIDVSSDGMETIQINNELIDFVDGIGFYQENQLTMIQSGILCSVYSDQLTKEEMIDVVHSLQVSALK